MNTDSRIEILVVGAGVAGIATAYYLCKRYEKSSVLLVDSRQPMSFTSAQSGDNYRNWWPHPTMAEFTNDSIDLMDEFARESSNVFNMTRRGYVLATREDDIDDLVADLHTGYRDATADDIRVHTAASTTGYVAPVSEDWSTAPRGVDVLSDTRLIKNTFPSLSTDIRNILHIRRAGDISGQQMGQYMLGKIKSAGGRRLTGTVRGIETGHLFLVEVEGANGVQRIAADIVVNAAGPFAGHIARMMNIDLPIENIYQQKIAFEDKLGAIPRQFPFSIDLDPVEFDWSDEEREFLTEDPATSWLLGDLPGGAHCRPEGGDDGTWVKLGWAFNQEPSSAQDDLANEPRMHPMYPEIVMRAAKGLNPSLAQYMDDFPTRFSHYGGYYPMTRENWPLIGPMGIDGAFITGALSGFGSMSACGAGALCAAWIADGDVPKYAEQLSLARYENQELMAELSSAESTGIL